MYRVAEHDRRCTVRDDATVSPLAVTLANCLYREFEIVNYLTTDLTLRNVEGKTETLPSHPAAITLPEEEVRIIVRTINGKRDNHGRGTSARRTIIIPGLLLHEGPVYVREVDLLLCRAGHSGVLIHPASADGREADVRWRHNQIALAAVEAPLVIIANDPSGLVTHIFTEVNGQICAARVTQFRADDEDDRVCIAHRDVSATGEMFVREHRTSFRELRKGGSVVWEIAGVLFSSNREVLAQHLELRRQQTQVETITPERHLEVVNHLKALHKEELDRCASKLKRADDLAKLYKDEATTLGRLNEQLKDVRFTERNAEVVLGTLHLEQAQLVAKQQALLEESRAREHKAEAERRAQRVKTIESALSTLSTVAKTAAVVAPAAFGLYKLYTTIKEG